MYELLFILLCIRKFSMRQPRNLFRHNRITSFSATLLFLLPMTQLLFTLQLFLLPLSSIFHPPLICLPSIHLPFLPLFTLFSPVTEYVEMSLLSCAMAGAGEKRKCGGKDRENSLLPPKKTTTKSTKGKHSISGINSATAELTTTFLVPFLGHIYCQRSSATALSSLDVSELVRRPCILSPIQVSK